MQAGYTNADYSMVKLKPKLGTSVLYIQDDCLSQVDGNCFNLLNIEFRGQYSGVIEFEMMPTVVGTATATLTFSENIMADDFYNVTVTVIQEPGTGEMSGFQQIRRETNLSKFT